jgi:integrase/recombinase XerD
MAEREIFSTALMTTIHLTIKEHENHERLFAMFEYDKSINKVFKEEKEAKWSNTKKGWYFPLKKESVEQIIKLTTGVAVVDTSELKEQLVKRRLSKEDERLANVDPETKEAIRIFKRWMEQKRYGVPTIKTYITQLIQFFRYYAPRGFRDISTPDVERYNHEVIIANGLSVSYQKGMVGAIKLFYSQAADTKMTLDNLQHPRGETRLPEVLSKDEVQRVINATDNLKHKALLSVTYACGLRRSEVLNLKIKDLDSARKLIRIEQAKGKKDRYVPFSENLKILLREYYKMYKPRDYLFEGHNSERYGERSFELILEQCVKKARIPKRVTLHTLRHSYATHQLEGGTDIRYIQELLGHNSPKTTMIYTHVSSKKISEIASPFDDLVINKINK